MKHFLPITTLIIIAILCPAAQSADIQARVDRNPIAVNESFQLILEASEQPDDDPDFSPLSRDFEILNQRQSNNIRMINGQVSRTIGWALTLLPRHIGPTRIPPIRFGRDSSPAIQLSVQKSATKQGATEDILLQMDIEPKEAYIQQQLRLTIRLYLGVNTSNASLTPPQPSDPDTIVRKLGEDRQFSTMNNGRRYQVTERRYVLFPQRSGILTIDPLLFQGEFAAPGTRGSLLFNSPFSGFGQTQRKQVRSNAVSVKVNPIPPGYPSAPWLPAGNLQLLDDWGTDDPGFKVGEPVTRTIMMMADGLTAAQLPAIDSSLSGSLKQYPDQPLLKDTDSEQGTTGLRQQKIAIVPTQPGEAILPAITVIWWNTTTGELETAHLPERRLSILPAPGIEQSQGLQEPRGTGMEAYQSIPEDKDRILVTPYPLWWIAFFAAGWLLTALAWWIRSRQSARKISLPQSRAPDTTVGTARNATGKQLKKACQDNDPEAAGKELLAWATAHWPDIRPLALGSLADCYAGSDAEVQIRELERHLYSPEKGNWDGQNLWRTMEGLMDEKNQKIEQREPISPLYPR
ncbi:MAG: protein BatD [Gammaproteobacteria bacterium]|nr:protein BatD [Gammaproteobacteria bacterium]